MPLSCILIEDEPLALERMEGFVAKLSMLQRVGSFDNALDAFDFLCQNEVDLIFLDINLGDMSGIQLLETKKVPAQVVITTAYPEYALKGYELKVADYLLKPFTFERFLQSVGRVQEILGAQVAAPPERDFFFVKSGHQLEKIVFSDIRFIEGMRDYRCIHTDHKRVLTLLTFGELETKLPSSRFVRVHKSFMISLERVDVADRDQVMIGDRSIPVSDTYRDGFWARIGPTKPTQ